MNIHNYMIDDKKLSEFPVFDELSIQEAANSDIKFTGLVCLLITSISDH